MGTQELINKILNDNKENADAILKNILGEMVSSKLKEIKEGVSSAFGVVNIATGKFTHVNLSKEKARSTAQGINVAHYGHQKSTGAGTDIPKAYAHVKHSPNRKIGEKYDGDTEALKWMM